MKFDKINFDNPFKKKIKQLKPTLSIINPFNNKGASIKMQNQWSLMNQHQKQIARIKYQDSDGDRVPDKFDCQPFNVMRQDFTPYLRKDNAYEMTAARRFGGQKNLNRLQRLGGGRDRDVYALDDDKVLKIAKNPGGLRQNTSEKDLDYLDFIKHYETGKDYVVMERAQPLQSKEAKQQLKYLKQAQNKTLVGNMLGNRNIEQAKADARRDFFNSEEFEKSELTSGLADFSVNPVELAAKRQWGEKDGRAVLVDAGSLQDDFTNHTIKDLEKKKYSTGKTPWELQEWYETQRERQQYKKKGKEDKPYKESYSENYVTNQFSEFMKPKEEREQEEEERKMEERERKERYEQLKRKVELSRLSKQAVQNIGEYNYEEKCSEGNCQVISKQILTDIKEKYPEEEPKLLNVTSYKDNDNVSYIGHKAVYLPKQQKIIDTQTWQYIATEPDELQSRNVLYDESDYSQNFEYEIEDE